MWYLNWTFHYLWHQLTIVNSKCNCNPSKKIKSSFVCADRWKLSLCRKKNDNDTLSQWSNILNWTLHHLWHSWTIMNSKCNYNQSKKIKSSFVCADRWKLSLCRKKNDNDTLSQWSNILNWTLHHLWHSWTIMNSKCNYNQSKKIKSSFVCAQFKF